MLNIHCETVNFVEENCYILSDETGEAVIVDCGALEPREEQAVTNYIGRNNLRPVHLLQTHGHFDHVFGADFVSRTYHLQPEMSADEQSTYERAAAQMLAFVGQAVPIKLPAVGRWLHDGDVVTFGSHTLEVIATPGHTPGGVCYYCAAEHVLISGDSLFRHEIGRCDLPGGNLNALVTSLKSKVLTLPDDVVVYPGHGPETTIGEERRENPYLR